VFYKNPAVTGRIFFVLARLSGKCRKDAVAKSYDNAYF
jgi:hypothetical protein